MALDIVSFTPKDKKLLKEFVQFQWDLYKDDKYFVPQMKMELLGNKLLGAKGLLESSHAFHKKATVQYFLAYRDGKPVGRMACTYNKYFNDYFKSNEGHFGFFEVIEDYNVAEELLNKGMEWFKEKGVNILLGPLNFTQEETLGVLIEGFDYYPFINTVYNKKYYGPFLEKYGFKKDRDLLAQLMPVKMDEENKNRHERLDRIVEKIKTKRGITFRPVNMNGKEFIKDLLLIGEIYNKAWANNWGVIPLNDEDLKAEADNLKMILDPNLLLLAYVKGKPAGMIISLPDVNEMNWIGKSSRSDLSRIIAIFKNRKKCKRVRLWALGILPEYRKIGVDVQ